MSLYITHFEKMTLDQFINYSRTYAQNYKLYTLQDRKDYAHKFLEFFPKFVNENISLTEHQWSVLDQSFLKILKGEILYWKITNADRYAYDDPLKLVFKVETLARRSFTQLPIEYKPVLMKSGTRQAIVSYAAIKKQCGEESPLFFMISNKAENALAHLEIKIEGKLSWRVLSLLFTESLNFFTLDLRLDANFSELFNFAALYQMTGFQQNLINLAIGKLQHSTFSEKKAADKWNTSSSEIESPDSIFEFILSLYQSHKEQVSTEIFFAFFDSYVKKCYEHNSKDVPKFTVIQHLISLYANRPKNEHLLALSPREVTVVAHN